MYRSNDWKKFKIAKRERFVAKMKKYKIRWAKKAKIMPIKENGAWGNNKEYGKEVVIDDNMLTD